MNASLVYINVVANNAVKFAPLRSAGTRRKRWASGSCPLLLPFQRETEMKKLHIVAIFFIALGALGSAHAAPTLRTSVPGSAIFFYVSNQEDRSYNCTITYSYSWDDFGTRQTRNDQSNASVPAKFDGQVLKVTQNAPNVALNSASLACN